MKKSPWLTRHNWSLLTHFIVATVAMGLPLLTVAGFVGYRHVTAERKLMNEKLKDKAEAMVATIDRELRGIRDLMTSLATSQSLYDGDLANFEKKAREVSAKLGILIVLRDLGGQQRINTRVAPGRLLPLGVMQVPDQIAIETRQPVISDLGQSPLDGRRFLSVIVPVLRDGAPAYLLASNLRPHLISNMLRDGLPDKSNYFASLTDRRGYTLGTSYLPEATDDLVSDDGFPNMGDERESWAQLFPEGSLADAAQKKSSLSGWTVALGVDRETLDAPLRLSLTAFGSLAALILFLSMILAFVVMKVVRRNFSELAESAEALGLESHLPFTPLRFQETSRLGDALKQISNHIRRQSEELVIANKELEARVAIRTEQLAISAKRAQQIADALPYPVWITTADGAVTYHNARMQETYGDITSTYEDRLKLYHPDDIRKKIQYHESPTASRGTLDIECRIADPSGTYQWHRLLINPLSRMDGPAEWICAAINIEDTRRVQDALESARQLAEQTSIAKTNFLATMSHEIRTPLNGVLGFTDILLAEPLTSEQRRKLGCIRSAGAALQTVVDDILDFSKLEAGKLEVERQPFYLRELLDDAISIVMNSATQKHLSLSYSYPKQATYTLIGDMSRLRQILLNLLNNAIKFTPEGSVNLTVSIEGDKPDFKNLLFEITDTGIGIAQQDFERLFERFSQVDGSTARSFGGAGLGLAISKNLVTLMGGTIGLRSLPGKGSTFWFKVGLPSANYIAEAACPLELPDPVQPLRILLAEDNEINQEIAKTALARQGHSVHVVPDGAFAVNALSKERYDIVLMDVQMPVMDGISATRAIRLAERGTGRRTPIIAMTANVLSDQLVTFAAAGMDGHIGKPFAARELGQIVRSFTERAANAGEPPVNTLDEARFSELTSEVGDETALRLLERFAIQMKEAKSWGRNKPRADLAWGSHRLIAPAGMLGLSSLSNACIALEQASQGTGKIDDELIAFHRALTMAEDALHAKFAAHVWVERMAIGGDRSLISRTQ